MKKKRCSGCHLAGRGVIVGGNASFQCYVTNLDVKNIELTPRCVSDQSQPGINSDLTSSEVSDVTLPEVNSDVTLPEVNSDVTLPEVNSDVTLPEVNSDLTPYVCRWWSEKDFVGCD